MRKNWIAICVKLTGEERGASFEKKNESSKYLKRNIFYKPSPQDVVEVTPVLCVWGGVPKDPQSTAILFSRYSNGETRHIWASQKLANTLQVTYQLLSKSVLSIRSHCHMSVHVQSVTSSSVSTSLGPLLRFFCLSCCGVY